MYARVFVSCLLAGVLIAAIGWALLEALPRPTEIGVQQPTETCEAAVSDRIRSGSMPASTEVIPEPLARSEAPLVSARGRRLRILDEHDAPVGGAQVAWQPVETSRSAEDLVTADVEPSLTAAPRCWSSADGLATLPIAVATALVIARAGERFGQRVIEFDDPLESAPVLRLLPDRVLRVAVVGPSGAACAEVPIDVAYRTGEGIVGSGMRTFRTPRSDPNGIVTLSHLQTLDFWAGCDPAVDLRAVVLGTATQSIHVRLVEPPSEPLELLCPAYGSFRVRAWVARNMPNHLELEPTISLVEDQGGSWVELLLAEGPTPAEWRVLPVALGRRWTLGAGSFANATRAGPTWHGEEVQVDLEPEEPGYGLSLRLLLPEGGPCARQAVRLLRPHEAGGQTDAEGRLCMTLGPFGGTLKLAVPALDAVAEIEMPDFDPSTRFLDLGVCVLRRLPRVVPPPLIVEGCVVDANTGHAVRATITVSHQPRGSDRARTVTRADGSFELRGDAGDTVWVCASRSGYESAPIEVARGSRTVLVLRPQPWLRATILVDDHVSVESLGVCLRDGDDLTEPARIERRPGRLTASFRLYADDLSLEVASAWFGTWRAAGRCAISPAGAGPSLLARASRSQWQEAGGGFSVDFDLRGELDQVAVSFRGPNDSGWLLLRDAGSRAQHAVLELAPHMRVAVPRGTKLEAIAAPADGCAVRAILAPGENRIDLPGPARVEIQVEGWPSGVDQERLRFGVFSLQYWDPLRAEVDVALGYSVATQTSPMPRTDADLATLETVVDFDIPLRVRVEHDRTSLLLNRLGSFVVVPFVGESRALLDAAVAIAITRPGQIITATVRIDPAKVRAIRR